MDSRSSPSRRPWALACAALCVWMLVPMRALAQDAGTNTRAVDAGADTGVDGQRPERQNTCATCHSTLPEANLSKPAIDFLQSKHRDERIGCAGCHGGDPLDPTVNAHDEYMDFTPHPTHAQIAGICGGCHGDAKLIRRFRADLPIDQPTLFRLSLHGKLVREGDEGAPTCTTCHGIHDIGSTTSATSPVSRQNVAGLCGGCHGDRERMKPYKLPTNQLAGWRRSAHARQLKEGNPKAPSCTGCHDAHAPTLPETKTAGHACGRCHEDQMTEFRHSAHTRPFARLGLSECTPCHGEHDVVRSSWLAGLGADSACSHCHTRDEKPLEIINEIEKTLRQANDRMDDARSRFEEARAAGLPVEQARFSLLQMGNAAVRLRVAVHSLNPVRLRQPLADVKRSADEAEAVVKKSSRERHYRRRGYYLALVIALGLFALLVAKAVLLQRRRRRSDA